MLSHRIDAIPALPLPFRGLVLERLGRIREGIIRVDGETLGRAAPDGLAARISVHAPSFWRRVAIGGALAAAEAYVDGDWSADDLTNAMRVLVRNRDVMDGLDGGVRRLARAAERVRHVLRGNTRAGSRRNIAEHYDLDDELFELMLDPTRTYSCGIFERPGSTLEEASLRKIDRLLEKLALGPGDHLLEIGTGWGALAIQAAKRTGCRVTTTTISRAQLEVARERVARAGVSDRVTVLLEDYRDLRGRFDRLASVEMIEAVGAERYGEFFRACARLLAPDGIAALQAITLPDDRFAAAARDVDFIKARIFPGSCIPSVTALLHAAAGTDLRPHHLEEIGPHYAPTLAAWRANLAPHRGRIVARQGERFWRGWMYYLCYCEAGFRERYLGNVQLVLRKPGARPPASLPALVEDVP